MPREPGQSGRLHPGRVWKPDSWGPEVQVSALAAGLMCDVRLSRELLPSFAILFTLAGPWQGSGEVWRCGPMSLEPGYDFVEPACALGL